ncbi:MAG: TetR/AcrR family transcriptional regulator [Vicinamibacterales bacterium]
MARRSTPRDARRWQRRPDDRPRVLMASALKLVKRQGYRRVRLGDIARNAGVSKATVYHYFANKDDLLTRSVASRMAERQVGMERRLAEQGGSAADRLQMFLRDFWSLSLTAQSGLWQRVVIAEMPAEAPRVFRAWARGLAQRWRFVERLIREGQRTGEFRRSADAAVASRLILSALAYQALFHVHLGVRRIAPCAVERLFDSSMDQWLHGLCSARAASRR